MTRVANLAQEVITVAATTAIDLQALGFEYGRGRKINLHVHPEGTTSNQVGDVQESSASGTGFADLQAYAGADGHKVLAISPSKRYLRINNESGTTAGCSFVISQ